MAGVVSIVIPTYNRCGELIACLRSIEEQTYTEREVIAVDDGSTDDTAGRLADEFPAARVVRTPGRCGPACARNVGLGAARGDLVLFLDSDTELPTRETLANAVGRLQADETIGLVGGEIADAAARPDEAYGRRITLNGESRRVTARPGAPVDCDYLATCNCLGRRSVMQRVGGFDPYYVFGAEDQDFCTRVRRLGLRCVASHEAAVRHKQSPRGRNPDETCRYHRTRVRYQMKLAGPGHLGLGFLYDLVRAAGFYCVLPVKLVVKLALRQPLRRENVAGGWWLLEAYWLNLARRSEIVRCRGADFLSDEELDRFVTWLREQGE